MILYLTIMCIEYIYVIYPPWQGGGVLVVVGLMVGGLVGVGGGVVGVDFEVVVVVGRVVGLVD